MHYRYENPMFSHAKLPLSQKYWLTFQYIRYDLEIAKARIRKATICPTESWWTICELI